MDQFKTAAPVFLITRVSTADVLGAMVLNIADGTVTRLGAPVTRRDTPTLVVGSSGSLLVTTMFVVYVAGVSPVASKLTVKPPLEEAEMVSAVGVTDSHPADSLNPTIRPPAGGGVVLLMVRLSELV